MNGTNLGASGPNIEKQCIANNSDGGCAYCGDDAQGADASELVVVCEDCTGGSRQ